MLFFLLRLTRIPRLLSGFILKILFDGRVRPADFRFHLARVVFGRDHPNLGSGLVKSSYHADGPLVVGAGFGPGHYLLFRIPDTREIGNVAIREKSP